jgi:aminopeptidase N
MTETVGALAILSEVGGEDYAEAMERFYTRWKDEPLVMNKWFSLQATSVAADTLSRVRALAAHPLFSLKNPNRVRALFGAFAHGNQLRFNDGSGEGYHLVADAVIEIDGFNPQVASRLVSAFESWRIFEPVRRAAAEMALNRILAKRELSLDVFELASKIAGRGQRPRTA